MTKKIRKILAGILAVCMLATLLPMQVLATEQTESTTDERPLDVVITVPTTDKDDPATEEKENQNTVYGDPEETTTVTGDLPESPEDTEYDYTTQTVTSQGSITVTTKEIETNRVLDAEGTDLEYVKSETNPDGTNDLTHVGAAPDMYQPGYEGEVTAPEGSKDDGYAYIYVGAGNTSKLVPAIVFKTPMSAEDKIAMYGESAYIGKSYTNYYVGCLSEEEQAKIAKDEYGKYVTDENGFLLDVDGNRVLKGELTATGPDGRTVYLHRFDATGTGHKVEGWYEGGEWVEELNGDKKFTAVWAGPQQFILVDDEGNAITTYCADFATPTQDAYGYFIQNLEDATYYSEEEAEQIRAIAMKGYWGTDEGFGSLEEMAKALKAAGFSDEELASLTDGVALTATQMAIWSCSNKMSGIEFINAHYSNWGTGNVPMDKEDEVKLMFKIYDYLTGLETVETAGTTADTIIGADFLKDLSINVLNKAEDHENNNDDDASNDAYVTNLTFALVVKPSTENGDDLVVTLVDAHGNVLAKARIAGEQQEGEEMLVEDENGNYTLKNIVMVEGDQTFCLNLVGVQNLDHGVYLYTSKVADGVSSQTMVGVAEGEQGVNVSMELTFNLSVEDEVIVTEHIWNEGDPVRVPPTTPPTTPLRNNPPPTTTLYNIEEEDVPLASHLSVNNELVEILDEEVPLAAVPETGDHSVILIIAIIATALLFGATFIVDKKRAAVK